MCSSAFLIHNHTFTYEMGAGGTASRKLYRNSGSAARTIRKAEFLSQICESAVDVTVTPGRFESPVQILRLRLFIAILCH